MISKMLFVLIAVAPPCLAAEPVTSVYQALKLWRSDRSAADAQYGDISAWDITDTSQMWNAYFKDDTDFNADISKWDTSKVTWMNNFFAGATAFNGDLSLWDTSKLKTAASMFKGATSFNGDISDWDTSSINNANEMFNGASSFSQDVGKWNIQSSQVVNMFQGVSPAFPCNSVRSWPMSKMTGCTFADTTAPTAAPDTGAPTAPTDSGNSSGKASLGFAAWLFAAFLAGKTV